MALQRGKFIPEDGRTDEHHSRALRLSVIPLKRFSKSHPYFSSFCLFCAPVATPSAILMEALTRVYPSETLASNYYKLSNHDGKCDYLCVYHPPLTPGPRITDLWDCIPFVGDSRLCLLVPTELLWSQPADCHSFRELRQVKNNFTTELHRQHSPATK